MAMAGSLSHLLGVFCYINHSPDGFNHLASRRCARSSKIACDGRQRTLPASSLSHGPCDAGDIRVFVLSNLHTDYEKNIEWIRCLSTVWYKKDVLIVAGDVAKTYDNFMLTISELKQRLDVYFAPRNQGLRCRRKDGFSEEVEGIA